MVGIDNLNDYYDPATGQIAGLHYIRTKNGTEVDFALSEEGKLTNDCV